MKSLFFAILLLAVTASAQEDKFIAILKSDAPVKEKADACLELAHVGTRQAVPVLAALLADEQLSHRARWALEAIPDPSVDAALRQALAQLKGQLLAGVIQSLGVRKDTKAVKPLAKLLQDADPAVAQAAARALGNIGGAGLPALKKAFSAGSPTNQPAIYEGLLRCAEALSGAKATVIYDKLLKLQNPPYQVRVAALSGAIRSRGAKGVPLLVKAIRTGSNVSVADTIRISMDMPGPAVTRALAGEIAGASEETQVLLVRTLGYRGDATAAPALAALAQSGSARRRIAAIQSLVQLRSPSSLALLPSLAKDPEPTVARAALTGLAGLPGNETDAAIVALLNGADTNTRIAAIEAVGQRRITAAVPTLLKAAADNDADVAGAGFKVLGELAGLSEIPAMVDALLQTKALTAAEAALIAACARQTDTAACTDQVLPGFAKAQGEPKLALLHVLASLGGPKALVAVRAAAAAPAPALKEAALRALCDWPTVEVLPDLAEMAKANEDTKFKLLALRGQIRLIPTETVTDAEKASQLQQILPLLEHAAEQRLALAALGDIPSAESLALIKPYLTSEGLKVEASFAAVAVSEKIVATHAAEVAAAISLVQTNDAQLAKRVRQVLARVPAGTN